MSLLNVWVSHATARVVVDTEGRTDEGEYFELSKMVALPHANAVIAGRGINTFLAMVVEALQLRKAPSFDAMAEQMPAVLQTVTGYLKTQSDIPHEVIHDQEIVLVGWSNWLMRMNAIAYASKTAAGFVETEFSKMYYSPWLDSWGVRLFAATNEQARVFSQEQIVHALALDPTAPIGGRLLLAELTRDDCRISTLARVTERALSPA